VRSFFSPLSLCSLSNAASTSLHHNRTRSCSLDHRNPLAARHRPVDRPSHGAVRALEGQAQGGNLTESIEQVDLH
jgi:hypothetical protein